MKERFPIGFWNYTYTGQLGLECVKDWKDAGMTVAMSPEYSAGRHKKEDMLALLDECERNDIKMIICDERTRWSDAAANPKGYEQRMREAYEDFGRHPATIGFHIGDEPWSEFNYDCAATAGKIHSEVAPELSPFLNLAPYSEAYLPAMRAGSVGEWAARMHNECGYKMFGYDNYHQMNPGTDGIHHYHYSLRRYSEAAKAGNLDLWVTLLSVGHFNYRCPKEDDLRWQLNTAVASGAKGILWFFLYMRDPISNYRVAPIDEFWERTETFQWLSRTNRHFLHRFGDFFLRAKHIKTYHVKESFGGFPLYEKGIEEALLDIRSESIPGIASFFELDGEKYLVLVNNSQTQNGIIMVDFPSSIGCFQRLAWNGDFITIKDHHWDAYYDEMEGVCTIGDWLAPGQMNVYRYKK